MSKKIFGSVLSIALVFGFTFSVPEISRLLPQLTLVTPTVTVPGPHFPPGPNEPLGPFPNIEFEHPHFMPGPNEPLGPFPSEITPPHCNPGPNEPLGPHFPFGFNQLRTVALTAFELPEAPVVYPVDTSGCQVAE